MHRAETVVLKLRAPGRAKRAWLDQTAERFRQGTQLGLDFALSAKTSNRGKIHAAAYSNIRTLGLPSDYCRMAVNQAVQLARSHFGLRKSKQRTGRPTVVRSQGIGLGVNAYRVVGTALRLSTGVQGDYIWLPLCVPRHWRDKLQYVQGDARLFKRGEDWFVMLPLRIPTTPTICDGHGEPTVIGVDLGIVRLVAAKHPNGLFVANGKPIRHEREHRASLRKRYQRHRRTDRVKAMRGKERRWMTDLNHKTSKKLVDLATQYPNPVLAFEKLDGIRDRVRGSKRFNRMVSSWAFRQLVDFVLYKAERAGVRVVFVDPRKTSRTCPRCRHATRANRPEQSHFRCVACGYQGNADVVASLNIADVAAGLLRHGPPDTARPSAAPRRGAGQPGLIGDRVDGVKVWASRCTGMARPERESTSAHADSNLESSA
ncbi:RNA-guided endonuclease TnpB family protein [Meiothermus sp. CFH 77666]|uniref:RNA-guided endonuclease InsQ/TnpB family protein n=1 Tax=Meiothermus sp. CFH 77666 TaxID=2817942 RepID=UPI001AA04362|nr:RNA-guided endonuclease TnpB family protein [Meiothermus sp. CFH 77666]MBO1437994.1 transposase [Meiothermus sp. CFH 77666]